MRCAALFGGLAVLLGAVSISLAARYGYKGVDTVVDGVISAVVFGAIALCAFLFDAAAVRLWFMGHRIGSVVIGLIAAAALLVTFTNSLGAIAGRADTTLAQRTRIADARADDRREQARLVKALADLDGFTPTDEAAVAAARRAADTATAIHTVECDKRGRIAAPASWVSRPRPVIWPPSPQPKPRPIERGSSRRKSGLCALGSTLASRSAPRTPWETRSPCCSARQIPSLPHGNKPSSPGSSSCAWLV